MDLSHFFERPILIKTLEWDDNTTLFQVENLWTQYFTHKVIWPKLLGFSRMTCNLEVEIRVNGSPFRFGDVLVSYRPLFQSDVDGYLSNYSGGYLTEDGCVSTYVSGFSVNPSSSAASLIARSQRQSCYLQVAKSIGCKMVLPFIYPFEALRVTSLAHDPAVSLSVTKMQDTTFYKSLASLGSLTFESLCTLRNTQVTSGVGVTIDVFVRAVNVRAWLASGVAAMEPQGKKGKGEEGIKPSQVTSAIAAGAKAFKDIPVIGPLATVGSMVAEGVTMVLQAFGFTPMALNLVTQPVSKALTFIQSSLSAPRNVVSLSLDHQNQVSIDPGIVGAPPQDELSLSSFCGRSSIATLTYFGSSCVTNDTIFLMPIHPMLGYKDNGGGTKTILSTRYQLLPCAFAAMNFKYWRGTCVVKLHAIKTQFHKGRLRVTWDPEFASSNATTYADFSTTHEGYQQMATWDLDAAECLTVKIGFGARTGRLSVPSVSTIGLTANATWKSNTEASSGPIVTSGFASDNYLDYANGFLRVSVLNRLQASDVTYPVPIVVSVHFEDLELYDPVDNGVNAQSQSLATYSSSANYDPSSFYMGYNGVLSTLTTRRSWPNTYYPQGGVEKDTMYEFQPSTSIGTLIYEGELCASLRALAARETYYDTLLYEVPAAYTCPDAASLDMYYSLTVPPSLITTNLPWRPGCFGTASIQRSSTFAIGSSAPTYTMTANDATSQIYSLSFARTPLCVLIQECFVGQRGSFNWKFAPGPSSGATIKSLVVSRSNVCADLSRVGSFPRAASVSPYTSTITPDATNYGFNYATEDRSTLVPLHFDTGAVTAPSRTISNPRSSRVNISMKLAQIRTVLNAWIGNFAAGAIAATSSENLVAGIRFPYFSLAKFLPGSSTGWMSKFGNAELASSMRLNIITEGSWSASHPSTPEMNNTSDTSWRIASGLPPRPYVSVHVSCSTGDDWSVAHFVNVPSLFSTVYPTSLMSPDQVDC